MTGAKERVVVVGDIRLDMVTKLRSAECDVNGVYFSNSVSRSIGGKAANQAVAASRLGADVSLSGIAGNDDFGVMLLAMLRKEHLDLRGVVVKKGAGTEVVIIIVEGAGKERMIAVRTGLIEQITPEFMRQVTFTSHDIVVSPINLREEASLSLYRRAKLCGATTILNATDQHAKRLFRFADYIVMNEHELGLFASVNKRSIDQISSAAGSISGKFGRTVIVTLGSRGVVCVSNGQRFRIPARNVPTIDTTGAGDCFIGALATALSESKGIEDALNFANIAASISVQRLGASTSFPSRDEVDWNHALAAKQRRFR